MIKTERIPRGDGSFVLVPFNDALDDLLVAGGDLVVRKNIVGFGPETSAQEIDAA